MRVGPIRSPQLNEKEALGQSAGLERVACKFRWSGEALSSLNLLFFAGALLSLNRNCSSFLVCKENAAEVLGLIWVGAAFRLFFFPPSPSVLIKEKVNKEMIEVK